MKFLFKLPEHLRYLNSTGQVAHGLFAPLAANPHVGATVVFMGGVVPEQPMQATCIDAVMVDVSKNGLVQSSGSTVIEDQITTDKKDLDAFARLAGFKGWFEYRAFLSTTYGLPKKLLYMRWENVGFLNQKPQTKVNDQCHKTASQK